MNNDDHGAVRQSHCDARDAARAMNVWAAPVALRDCEFERIRRLAHAQFGLDLKDGKQELVSARLGKLMRRGGFTSFKSYCDHVVSDRSGEALIEMIDALTTNYTSFLREPAHFEFLQHAVRNEFQAGGAFSPVRIWSAACATGEEPYSIAFHLVNAGLPLNAFRILATDISTRALDKARSGVYAADRMVNLPPEWLRRFALQGNGDSKGLYKVKSEIAQTIEFRRLNLMEPFCDPETYHVVFCRNVMMYFDRSAQADLVRRLAARLVAGGYLFVGHSESLTGLEQPLAYCRPAIYRNGPARNRRGPS